MRCFPHSTITAQSRITSRHSSSRDLSSRPPSLAPCSPPSRRGLSKTELAARAQRRPSLTAAARGASAGSWSGRRNGSRSNKETDKKGKQGRKKARRSSPRSYPLTPPAPYKGGQWRFRRCPRALQALPPRRSPAGSTSDDIHLNPIDHERPCRGSMIGQAASRVGNVEAAVAHSTMRGIRNSWQNESNGSPPVFWQNEPNPESVIDGDRSRI